MIFLICAISIGLLLFFIAQVFIGLCLLVSHMSGKEFRVEAFRSVLQYQCQGCSVREACDKAQVSRSSYYRWCARVKEYCRKHGVGDEIADIFGCLDESLKEKSRKPKRNARRMLEETKELIVEIAKSGRHKSGSSVAREVRERGVKISEKKTIEVLRDAGIYNCMKKGVFEAERKDK